MLTIPFNRHGEDTPAAEEVHGLAVSYEFDHDAALAYCEGRTDDDCVYIFHVVSPTDGERLATGRARTAEEVRDNAHDSAFTNRNRR